MYGSPERAELAAVRLLGDLVGPLHQLEVGLRVQRAVHREQRLEHRAVLGGSRALAAHPAGQAGAHPPGGRWGGNACGVGVLGRNLARRGALQRRRAAHQRSWRLDRRPAGGAVPASAGEPAGPDGASDRACSTLPARSGLIAHLPPLNRVHPEQSEQSASERLGPFEHNAARWARPSRAPRRRGAGYSSRPRRMPSATAAARSDTPSFSYSRWVCVLTVLAPMYNSAASCGMDWPSGEAAQHLHLPLAQHRPRRLRAQADLPGEGARRAPAAPRSCPSPRRARRRRSATGVSPCRDTRPRPAPAR